MLSFTLVLSMAVMMLALFLYAEDVFGMAGETEMAWLRSAYRWASLVLTTPILFLCGRPLLRAAWASLRSGRVSMEALILLGSLAAYGLSASAVFRGKSGVYFDSAAAALVLVTLGRYLEATARTKASQSLGPLVEVSRETVTVLDPEGARRLGAAELAPGMRIHLDAHAICPVDMTLEEESAEVDLAVLTGEPHPVALRRGDTVPAGAVAGAAALIGIALKSSSDSTLERLSQLAKSLTQKRTGVLRWADRFAAALTPIVWLVAGGAFWWGMRSVSAAEGTVRALAVVLAACPCSYAIASPLVHWLSLRKAFSQGVLIRSPEATEALARTRIVAFDKTGTLTRPSPSVSAEHLAEGVSAAEVSAYVLALEEGTHHPIGRALVDHAEKWRDIAGKPLALRGRRSIPGRGVTAVDPTGETLFLGANTGGHIELTRNGIPLAKLEVAEALRPEALEAVMKLRALGVRSVLISGDHASRVEPVARALSIPWHAGASPALKQKLLEELGPEAAMVGDGINDAPALAARMTSFSLGGAAPLAKGLAQVTLLDGDLRHVPWTIALARQSVRRVKGLLTGSTSYNLVFVSLAATGALRPVWAGLSMLVSSLVALAYAAAAGRETGAYSNAQWHPIASGEFASIQNSRISAHGPVSKTIGAFVYAPDQVGQDGAAVRRLAQEPGSAGASGRAENLNATRELPPC
jgi:heavy metal translocating P-type ATPase